MRNKIRCYRYEKNDVRCEIMIKPPRDNFVKFLWTHNGKFGAENYSYDLENPVFDPRCRFTLDFNRKETIKWFFDAWNVKL